jgi:TetR/AcrR family transcriptional repressor of nem operon
MGRKKEYDRDDVLSRAMGLFWKAGFEGAHLSTLVDVTGLNRFSLYKEFGGKEGLFQEAFELYLVGARDAYARYLEHEPYGFDNIRSYFSAVHYSPDYHGCFLINTLADKHVVPGKAFRMAKAFSKDAERMFLKNLEAAKSSGELPADSPTKALAKLLLSFDQGLAIYGIVRPNNTDKTHIVSLILELITGKVF